jgi:hypothetical protein
MELSAILFATEKFSGTIIGASEAKFEKGYRCIGCGDIVKREKNRFVHEPVGFQKTRICNYSHTNVVGLALQQQLPTLPALSVYNGVEVVNVPVKQWRQNKPFKRGKANLYCLMGDGRRVTIDIPFPGRNYESIDNITHKETDFAFAIRPDHRIFTHDHFCIKPMAEKFRRFIVNNPKFLIPLLPVNTIKAVKTA